MVMVQWVGKDVFYEQHGGCGPSWTIHLLGCWLPMFISWCHHHVWITSIQKLALVFCAYQWVFWVCTRGPTSFGWGDICYASTWEVWTCSWAWFKYNKCLWQYVCWLQCQGGVGNWGVEVKMKMVNEVLWFHKIQIQSFISCNNYLYNILA